MTAPRPPHRRNETDGGRSAAEWDSTKRRRCLSRRCRPLRRVEVAHPTTVVRRSLQSRTLFRSPLRAGDHRIAHHLIAFNVSTVTYDGGRVDRVSDRSCGVRSAALLRNGPRGRRRRCGRANDSLGSRSEAARLRTTVLLPLAPISPSHGNTCEGPVDHTPTRNATRPVRRRRLHCRALERGEGSVSASPMNAAFYVDA